MPSCNPSSVCQSPAVWPRHVRYSILQVCSLAHWAIIHTRSWCADSPLVRVRLAGKLDQARNELALVLEQLRINNARMAGIPPHQRPFYPPTERMAILELKAVRGWNLAQTARAFLVEPETISSWMKRLDDPSDTLVQIPSPSNKFPLFVHYVVQRLKTLCPPMGKRRIAGTLARAGILLAPTTVGRMLKAKPVPPVEPRASHITPDGGGRTVTARYPNHVWHVDLTVVPTTAGFWVPWFPFCMPQVWPFCWWVAVIVDHFSRKVMGFALFRRQPSSLEVRSFIGNAIRKAKSKPRHMISDRGCQFDCTGFRKWTKRKKIKLRYGAVGNYGSIAIVERFIRSLKSECTRTILVPVHLAEMRNELGLYVTWYNDFRPHQALQGHTPQQQYNQEPLKLPIPTVPNSQLPEMALRVSYVAGRKHLPIVLLEKAA